MKILVTGAKGFVGKKLVTKLKNNNYSVIEFDIKQGQNILNKNHLEKALNGVDVVFHLAAIIENSNKNLWKINVTGTEQLIKESIKAKVKQIILLSSTGVYGYTKELIDEKSDLNPKTLYEKSKVEAEIKALSYSDKINVKIVRSAMIFGANNYWKQMIDLLEKNYPLPIMGKNKFQIIYVKELINALLIVMKKSKNREIYVVAGKERWTFKEFCKKIKEIGWQKEVVFGIPKLIALPLGKLLGIKELTLENLRHLSKDRKYDIKKIESIGYKQKISLEKAIIETLNELNKQKTN